MALSSKPSSPERQPKTNQPEPSNKDKLNNNENPQVRRGVISSAFALFKPSKDAVMKNLNTFLLLTLVPSMYFLFVSLWDARSFGSSATNQTTVMQFRGTALVLLLIGVLYSVLILAALPYTQLKSAQGNTVEISEAFSQGFHYFWRILGLYIVMGLAILGGFILFIVPGVILIGRYFLAPYFLIDQNLGIREAIRASSAATKGRAMNVWGIIGVYILCALPSIIPIAGSIASAILQMLYSCAPALRYEQFKQVPQTTD